MPDTPTPPTGNKPEPTPYELEPAAPAPPPPPPGSKTPSDQTPKLKADPVLTGFDEDADFDKDPEVERALKDKPIPTKRPSTDPTPQDPKHPFVKPGFGNAQVWGIAGGFLLVGAVVAAATYSHNKLAMSLLVLYSGLIHTGTGLVAVYLTARLHNQPVGQIELAAGRMITAIGAFLLIFNLNIPLLGDTKWEELTLAAIAYIGVLAGLFRLWGRTLAILGGTHFMLWMIVELGMMLSTWANSGLPPPTGAGK